jgi:hypothetical protein
MDHTKPEMSTADSCLVGSLTALVWIVALIGLGWAIGDIVGLW